MDAQAEAGPSRSASPPSKRAKTTQTTEWSPEHLRYEAPQPPPIDVRIEEEAAAQATAQAAGLEARRARKFLQRRTVDYFATHLRYNIDRLQRTCYRHDDQNARPSLHFVSKLQPPIAYSRSSTSIASTAVHTSTNKVRCPVNVVAWTPEGRRLLTGSQSGEFTLWNGLTFNFETILQAHDSPVRAFEWSKSGVWLVSGDQNGTIKYFQTNMNNLQAFEGHREAIRGVSFSPDDARFVTASDDSTLKIWAFDEAREETTLRGHGWDVKCVDWHPTKGLIVSGSKDNLVNFWDPRSGANLTTLHGHKQTVQACKWGGPSDNLVVTASRDHFLRIYDIRTMKDLFTLRGHKNEVCSAAWHPIHTDLLVSGGSEGSLVYWSLNAEDPETPLHAIDDAHQSNIWSLEWHPLGHLLASGGNDHATKFWARPRPGGPEPGHAGHIGAEPRGSEYGGGYERDYYNRGGGGGGGGGSFIPGGFGQ